MAKTIDEAINELFKDYTRALNVAVKYAADRASEDIWKYSLTCLEEYYDNYEPSRYQRTDSLWHGIVPYSEIKNSSKGIICRVGVEYNPSVLEAYTSGNLAYNGSSEYSPVDGWYVLENYLNGVHPATNGSSNPDTVVYYENVDPISPTEKMRGYLNKYTSTTFHNNLLISFAKQIMR